MWAPLQYRLPRSLFHCSCLLLMIHRIFRFWFFLSTALMPRDMEHVVPLHRWSARTLPRCACLPVNPPSLTTSTEIPNILSSFPICTSSLGLQTLLMYITKIVIFCFSFVRLWPVWTPGLEVARRVEPLRFLSGLFWFGFLFLPLRATMFSVRTRVECFCYVSFSFYLAFCAPAVAQASVGCK